LEGVGQQPGLVLHSVATHPEHIESLFSQGWQQVLQTVHPLSNTCPHTSVLLCSPQLKGTAQGDGADADGFVEAYSIAEADADGFVEAYSIAEADADGFVEAYSAAGNFACARNTPAATSTVIRNAMAASQDTVLVSQPVNFFFPLTPSTLTILPDFFFNDELPGQRPVVRPWRRTWAGKERGQGAETPCGPGCCTRSLGLLVVTRRLGAVILCGL
jgi:hypothetical protein